MQVRQRRVGSGVRPSQRGREECSNHSPSPFHSRGLLRAGMGALGMSANARSWARMGVEAAGQPHGGVGDVSGVGLVLKRERAARSPAPCSQYRLQDPYHHSRWQASEGAYPRPCPRLPALPLLLSLSLSLPLSLSFPSLPLPLPLSTPSLPPHTAKRKLVISESKFLMRPGRQLGKLLDASSFLTSLPSSPPSPLDGGKGGREGDGEDKIARS